VTPFSIAAARILRESGDPQSGLEGPVRVNLTAFWGLLVECTSHTGI
jgi:hypothetical protein